MFTMNNLKHFIKPFLENPVDEYKRIGLFVFFRFVHHYVQWCYFFLFVATIVFLSSLTVICMYISSVMFLCCMLCNSSHPEPSPQQLNWRGAGLQTATHISPSHRPLVSAAVLHRRLEGVSCCYGNHCGFTFVMWVFVQCLFDLLYYFMW